VGQSKPLQLDICYQQQLNWGLQFNLQTLERVGQSKPLLMELLINEKQFQSNHQAAVIPPLYTIFWREGNTQHLLSVIHGPTEIDDYSLNKEEMELKPYRSHHLT
jgi:hypothetical protein